MYIVCNKVLFNIFYEFVVFYYPALDGSIDDYRIVIQLFIAWNVRAIQQIVVLLIAYGVYMPPL